MLVLILLAGVWACAMAYPTGAPVIACETMVPQHNADSQNTTTPYTMHVTKGTDHTDQTVYHVMIEGSGSTKFKGFFIQARKIDNEAPSHEQPLLGMFDILDTKTTHSRICGETTETNGVTHTDNTDKDSVEVVWYPPTGSIDGVQIVATVVQSKEVFWVGMRKPVVP